MSKAQKNEIPRCEGCGEELTADDKVVHITAGELSKRKLKATPDSPLRRQSEWGYMHDHCFRVAIGDPDAVDALVAESA